MPAYVEYSFRRGFLLDEARLRKIRSSLDARLSKRPTPLEPTYKVYRGDAYSYTTAEVDDVLREDNEDWRRITRLDVMVDEKDKLELRLTFSTSRSTLNIVGDDRDEVFLLFSDLRDYIDNEVAVAPTISTQGARVLSLLFMLAAMAPLILSFMFQSGAQSEQSYQDVLAISDIRPKIDFLIATQRERAGGKLIGLSFAMMIFATLLIVTDVTQRMIRYIFPGNQFLFGKQQQVYLRRRRLVGNLVWIVGVGLVVSVIAGLIVWFLTTSKHG